MNEQDRYLHRLLDSYRRLPGTLGRVLRVDRRTALALYRRRIDLDVIHHAFILGTARRTFATYPASSVPIRTLRYFLPLIDEVLDSPPDPEYLGYLRLRLRLADLHPET